MGRIKNPFKAFSDRVLLQLDRMTTAGEPTDSLESKTRQNLYWFWFDGFFASAGDSIPGNYMTLYVLALGASRGQIGLMSSLSSMTAALLLLPGAMLVERVGHRKIITLLTGGGARLVVVLLALLPFVFSGPALIPLAIALSVLRDGFNNLSYPAWLALTADMVPLNIRGRYFASRNFAMGISSTSITLLAGELITRLQFFGYQLAFLAAGSLGFASTYSFAHLNDPDPEPAGETARLSLRALIGEMRGLPAFMALASAAALWNFSLNISGPFFNVYLVENLQATATQVGFLSIVSNFANLLAQPRIGVLADRWGSWRLQLAAGLFIPLLPLFWLFTTSPWHVIPINLISGVLWGAYNMASFNLLLIITPAKQRARYSALYQIIVFLSLSIGAAAGGVIIEIWGYEAGFIISAAGRLLGAICFAHFVPRPMEDVGQRR